MTQPKLRMSKAIPKKIIAENLSLAQVHRFLSQLLLNDGLTFSRSERNELKTIVKKQNVPISFLNWETNRGHIIRIQKDSKTQKYSIMFGQDKSEIFYPMIQEIIKCII